MTEILYEKITWEDNVTELNAYNMNHIENGIETLATALGTKVDKLTGQAMVYRTNPSSNSDTDYISYTSENTPKTFMVRDANGRTSVASPTASSHVANKDYVDKSKIHITYGPLDASLLKSATWISSASQSKGIISVYVYGGHFDVLKIDFISQRVSYALEYEQATAPFSDCHLDSVDGAELTLEYLQNYLMYTTDMPRTIFLVEYK